MSEILVVVPAYNSSSYIAQCIESVQSQTFSDWDLVLIDDGSKDATLSIVKNLAQKDSRIHIRSQTNSGVAVARNRGLDYINDETAFVMFLDNDDYLFSDTLQYLRQSLLENPIASVAYGLPRSVGKNGEVLNDNIIDSFGFKRCKVEGSKMKVANIDEPTTFSHLVVWDCIATPGQALIRRTILDVVGKLDPETVPSDDWDLWLRLSLQGPFVFASRFVINKRSHEENVSSKGKVMAVAEPVIRHKLAVSNLLTPEQRRIAKTGHLFSCYLRLKWAFEGKAKFNIPQILRSLIRFMRAYRRYIQTSYIGA